MSNIDPTREQFDNFKSLDRDSPILMLNLIRLRETADYHDGRSATGVQAYTTYGEESGPMFMRVGGEIVWRGNPESTVIGPQDERWDIAFIARYPTADAFLEMVTSAAYQAIVFHRQAAVKDSRLVRMGEIEDGTSFGG